MSKKRIYTSFYCPTVLIDAMDDLIEKWPGKFNHTKIICYAAMYACQENVFEYKEVFSAEGTEKQMVRVTPQLLKKIDEILEGYSEKELTKTQFFIIALNMFLKKCDEILKKMDSSFLTETEKEERGLILRRTLNKLFPNEEDILDLLCEEKFDAGDKLYCITTKKKLALMLLDKLYTNKEIHPSSVY